jgi:hypothetical protein
MNTEEAEPLRVFRGYGAPLPEPGTTPKPGIVISQDARGKLFATVTKDRGRNCYSVVIEPVEMGVRDDGRTFYIVGAPPSKRKKSPAAPRRNDRARGV